MRSKPIQLIEMKAGRVIGLLYKVREKKKKKKKKKKETFAFGLLYTLPSAVHTCLWWLCLSVSASTLGICCAGDQSCFKKVNHEGSDHASSGVFILE